MPKSALPKNRGRGIVPVRSIDFAACGAQIQGRQMATYQMLSQVSRGYFELLFLDSHAVFEGANPIFPESGFPCRFESRGVGSSTRDLKCPFQQIQRNEYSLLGRTMKVVELKKTIDGYRTEQLRTLLVEMYKAMPKHVKEDHGIDDLICNSASKPNKGKSDAAPDIEAL